MQKIPTGISLGTKKSLNAINTRYHVVHQHSEQMIQI